MDIIELIAKAERNERATRQEQDEVRMQRAKKNLAWKISREIDTITFDKKGILFITDCKFSDNGEFIIDSKDIAKGLDLVNWIKEHFPILAVEFRVDMHFPRTRQLNNRRYIPITEDDRGWSIKCVKTRKKIMTTKVRKGHALERD